MNLTLHLTEACNLNCSYCTRAKRPVRMTQEVMEAACRLAFSSGTHGGICFFGGEPLTERSLLLSALDYCGQLSRETGKPFQCRMTTNGTLLDEAFLRRAAALHMGIGFSHDGTAHDLCRKFPDGRGSAALLQEKAKLLLRFCPDAAAMMTIAPEAAGELAAGIRLLRQTGFRNITVTPAYGRLVRWTDEALETLLQQLREASEDYAEAFLAKRPYYLAPLDSKIRENLAGENPADHCHLGLRQMPVTPDGKLYACTQFIGDPDYLLGDVFTGLDDARVRALAQRHSTPETCRECDLRRRCTNACGCLNRLETGDAGQVSAFQCSYQRMVIALADETADRLYDADPKFFADYFTRRKHARAKGTEPL